MANIDQPFGLRPVRYRNGSPWTGAFKHYYVPSTDANDIFIGDPVVIVGDANDNEVLGFPAGTLSEVTIGAAGDGVAITGVCVGVLPATRSSTIYRAASVETVIKVVDDPNVVFEIQDDGGGTPTNDWVGLNANLVAGTGVASTGMSGWELDGGTSDGPDADASNQLFILGLAPRQDNAVGDNAVWEVLINQHTYQPASGLGIA